MSPKMGCENRKLFFRNWRILEYATIAVTQKLSKKTSKVGQLLFSAALSYATNVRVKPEGVTCATAGTSVPPFGVKAKQGRPDQLRSTN